MSQHPNGPPISEEQLVALPPDVQQLIGTIIDYYETRIQDLESRLGMNPQNSSLPPSSEHPHAKQPKPKPSGRKRGGQKGHKKHQRTIYKPSPAVRCIRQRMFLDSGEV